MSNQGSQDSSGNQKNVIQWQIPDTDWKVQIFITKFKQCDHFGLEYCGIIDIPMPLLVLYSKFHYMLVLYPILATNSKT